MSFNAINNLKSALFSNSARTIINISKRYKGQRDAYLDGAQYPDGRAIGNFTNIKVRYTAVENEKQEKALQVLKNNEIAIDNPDQLSVVSGAPSEHVVGRRARIYKPSKNAMQSGTFGTHKWKVDFENRERWENPLMGWTSSGDPISNLQMWFTKKEDAIEFCERQGYIYDIDEPQERRNLRKSYAENFAWNKNTRIGSK